MDIGSEADKCRSSSFITYLGQWFRGRQTPENIPEPPPNDPQISTTALPVRVSSFGNGTPKTGNPIHRQKQQPLDSVGSRLSPLSRRVANESSPFCLGIFHRTLLLPTSSQPFPTRQNNSVAPPSPTQPVSTEHLCPGPLHCRRDAPDDWPLPFSIPTCYQRATLLRFPPIRPIPRPTACTLLTTRDPTEPLCSVPVCGRSPPGDVSYGLEDSSHSLYLVGLASSNSSPIYPRHCRPSGDSSRPPPHGLVNSPFGKRWSPYRPLFTATLPQTTNGTSRPASQFTHQRTQTNDDFSVFPQPQQTHGLSLPTKLFSHPLINRIHTTNGPSASSTTQPRATFPTTAHRRSRANASAYTAFLISTLVRHHDVLSPSGLFFFLWYVSFLSNHRLILFPLPVNTKQFPSNPTVANPHPTLKTRLRHQYRHPPFASTTQ